MNAVCSTIRLILLTSAAACPALAAPPPGEIAFMRSGFVYLADADGGNVRQIAEEKTFHADRPLVWSPDGGNILYWDHARGGWDILSVNVASLAVTNLTNDGPRVGGCRSAAYSPDRSTIAFMRDEPPGLWIMPATGAVDIAPGAENAKSRLRPLTPRGHRDAAPVWSPDGSSLCYVEIHHLEGDYVRPDVRIVAADGRTDRILADNCDHPCFLADGQSILAEGLGQQNYEIFNIQLADRRRTNITKTAELNEKHPSISPGRDRVACMVDARSDRGGGRTWSIAVFQVDGSSRRDFSLPEGDVPSGPASWSPDGKRVAFGRGQKETSSVWVLDVEGGSYTRIAGDGAQFPAWRPQPPQSPDTPRTSDR